jgi:hypothetical protein
MSESEARGVFISRGMQLRLPSFSISIAQDRTPRVSPITPELSYDLWPLWMRIALEHERMAKVACARLES